MQETQNRYGSNNNQTSGTKLRCRIIFSSKISQDLYNFIVQVELDNNLMN